MHKNTDTFGRSSDYVHGLLQNAVKRAGVDTTESLLCDQFNGYLSKVNGSM